MWDTKMNIDRSLPSRNYNLVCFFFVSYCHWCLLFKTSKILKNSKNTPQSDAQIALWLFGKISISIKMCILSAQEFPLVDTYTEDTIKGVHKDV